ncbi:MAG: hypothetical protein P1U50_07870 [Parvibaculaceae bacterium]|nr:hypothetical protein [Parvibaculaceae bacterium]
MPLKIFVTLNAFIFVVVLPVLEIGPSHVFNQDWPGHARLHEVWQLLSNATFALFSVWLVWWQGKPLYAAFISLVLSGSFLIAYFVRGTYGGTMTHSDGSELLLYGVNPAFGLLLALSIGLIFFGVRQYQKQLQ